MAETLKVVIAEDNYLVREGVRRLLEDSGQVEVVDNDLLPFGELAGEVEFSLECCWE